MFSVVIPLHNKRQTLSASVASVLAQSFADFELVVVDDGSTDGSLDTLREVSDPRLRTCRQANRGPGPARNRGVEIARHDWIAFLDADDLWDEDHLEELDRIRRLCPEAVLIGTRYRRARAGNAARSEPDTDGAAIGPIDYFAEVASGRPVLCASTAAVRRQAWQALGGFGSYPNGQDSEFWVRVASRWPVATSKRVTATYVQGTGGVSDQRWRGSVGRAPQRLEDLSVALMRVLALRETATPERRMIYDRYVDRYVSWWVQWAAAVGDVPTLRALRRLRERRGSTADEAVLLAAALPAPVARILYRAARWARAANVLRAAKRLLRETARRR